MKVSKLTENLSTTGTTVWVEVASYFPESGYIVINGEVISYSDRGPNYFTVLERGVGLTFAKNHPTDSRVVEYQSTQYIDLIERNVMDSIGDDLYFDGNGDLEILSTGDFKFVSGLDALHIRLRMRALSLVGFGGDPAFGVKIWGDNSTAQQITDSLLATIKDDDGVQSAELVSATLDNEGILTVNLSVIPKGLNNGVNFTFKLNHRDRGM